MNLDVNELGRQRQIDAVCDLLFNGDEDLCMAAHGAADTAPGSWRASRESSAVARSESRRSAIAPLVERRPTANRELGGKGRGFGLAWLAACLLLAAWVGFGYRGGPPKAPRLATGSAGQHATRAIEDIRVGQRVVANNPDLSESERSNDTAVDPATWRLVRLHAENRWDDGTIEVETLQPLEWIAENRLRPGSAAPLPLDLVEMGLPESLKATVVAVGPCPPIESGPGNVVLTTVNHLNQFICELTVEDERGGRETIQPTGLHKFYSDTRAGWISASELRRGERLRGLDGPLTVIGVTRRPGVERVYNMTVEGQHVYYVGALANLVHNNACGGSAASPTSTAWPSTPQEMNDFLGMAGTNIPDTAATVGRGKVVWRPNAQTKIVFEQHPYHASAPAWHKGPHWHLDLK